MPAYIEKEALMQSISDKMEKGFPANKNLSIFALSCINHAPNADVAPIRRGEWIDSEDYKGLRVCSACHDCYVDTEWVNKKKWSYCPNCGADMRKEHSNENS
ncbi:MAG: hypothetical protein VB078_00335 [Clostridiaceae bacterium]|nr:hypothetical protein [Clostridiaceae bacterium]